MTKLKNRQAAEPLGVALKTVENWRLAGKGLQELLGHATLAMTMRYAHLTPEYLRRAGGSTT
jgi:integrase